MSSTDHETTIVESNSPVADPEELPDAPPMNNGEAPSPADDESDLSSILSSPPQSDRKRSNDSAFWESEMKSSPTKGKTEYSPAPKKPRLTEEQRKLAADAKQKEKDAKMKKDREAKEAERKAKEAEKEQKRLEKEREKAEKQRIKDEEKAKKEEEKRKKEEEKRKKDEEKRKAVEAREEEKRKKEEEKKKKEDEKKKKDGTQMKLNNFFVRPASKLKAPSTITPEAPVAEAPRPAPAPINPDYAKYFLPFNIKPNVTLAPFPYFNDCPTRPTHTEAIDVELAQIASSPDTHLLPKPPLTGAEFCKLLNPYHPSPRIRQSGILAYSTKDIIARINAPDDPSLPPIGPIAKSKSKPTAEYYLSLLNRLPNKNLKFAEDVRPPYHGTYTRKPTDSSLLRGRRPFTKALPGVDYDYDSEAEWVADEEEDGEELLSDDEEDKESNPDSDDLEGFLDDEEDVGVKRSTLGALIATNSGLCWEDDKGVNPREDLEGMRIEPLLEGIQCPIDPFSSSYWAPPPRPTIIDKKHSSPHATTKSMPPPAARTPLSTSTGAPNSSGIAPIFNPGGSPATGSPNVASGPKKYVPDDELEDFKKAIDGSDMTKAGLIEVLKKTFPKIPKDAIKNSLDLVAERVGNKRDEKRWILKG